MEQGLTHLMVEQLGAVGESVKGDLATANRLERQAAELRDASPLRVDAAIRRAVGQLIDDAQAGLLTPRESFEAAVDIIQFTPSNVIRSEPPDKLRSMDTFDRLSEAGTPVLIADMFRMPPWIGIGLGGIPRVDITIPRGMGGLPDANVIFEADEVGHDGTAAVIESRVEKSVSLLFGIGKTAAGAAAINELVQNLSVWRERYACGHGHRTNAQEVEQQKWRAQVLAEASGFEILASDTHV